MPRPCAQPPNRYPRVEINICILSASWRPLWLSLPKEWKMILQLDHVSKVSFYPCGLCVGIVQSQDWWGILKQALLCSSTVFSRPNPHCFSAETLWAARKLQAIHQPDYLGLCPGFSGYLQLDSSWDLCLWLLHCHYFSVEVMGEEGERLGNFIICSHFILLPTLLKGYLELQQNQRWSNGSSTAGCWTSLFFVLRYFLNI